MKMIKNPAISIVLCFLLIGVAASSINAQTANINVKLSPLLALTVNTPDVNINFNTLTDYQNGVTVPMPGHLTVSSLLPYTVSVKANDATLSDAATTPNTMNVNIVTAVLTAGGTTGGTVAPATPLSNATANPLVTLATPALAKVLDVTYAVPSSVSNSAAVLGHPSGTYKTVVTYSIVNL
ncbi:MAG TPA: hypothetical protein VL053_16915 [Arachidicoccus sp.]|nr:hypothetical protein [Arachidicoccus sp.]